jgi:hypothetical protein
MNIYAAFRSVEERRIHAAAKKCASFLFRRDCRNKKTSAERAAGGGLVYEKF